MDREKIINAIEKAKKQSEEYAQDHIIVPFKEADMILALLKEQKPKKEKAINYLLEIGWLQEHDAILLGYNPNAENQPCPPMPKAVKLK